MGSILTTTHRVDLLKGTPFFQHLAASMLLKLASGCNELPLEDGGVLCTVNDPGDALYVVAQGNLEVFIDDTVLDTVGPGASLGEMALVTDEARSASIRAAGPALVMVLPSDLFRMTLEANPTMAWGIFRELSTKIHSSIDVRVQLDQARASLAESNRQLRASQKRIERDLQAAARLQQGMLPPADLGHRAMELAWRYLPCDEIGGDALGLDIVDERYLVAYVLDVTGHGVPAALMSYSVAQTLVPSAGVTVQDPDPARMASPSIVAATLNQRFPFDSSRKFFTMFYAVIDLATGRMDYTSAGHPPPLLSRRQEWIALEERGGCPIGIMPDEDYPTTSVQLERGDRLFIVSDGVLEQRDPGGTMAGEERVRGWIDNAGDALDEVLDHIITELGTWSAGPFDDDVSIAALTWIG